MASRGPFQPQLFCVLRPGAVSGLGALVHVSSGYTTLLTHGQHVIIHFWETSLPLPQRSQMLSYYGGDVTLKVLNWSTAFRRKIIYSSLSGINSSLKSWLICFIENCLCHLKKFFFSALRTYFFWPLVPGCGCSYYQDSVPLNVGYHQGSAPVN